MTDFGVRTLFGANTRRGLVELILGEVRVQVLPTKARELAALLLEAAGAAEGDEVLMRVFERTGMSPQRSAQVLLAFRQERAVIERRNIEETRKSIAEDRIDLDAPTT